MMRYIMTNLFEHNHKKSEVRSIADYVLQKIEMRMKASAKHPSEIANCQFNELCIKDYMLTETTLSIIITCRFPHPSWNVNFWS